MSLTDDLRSFVFVPPRRPRHGDSKVSAEAESGYDLRLRCTCGQHYYVS